MKTVDASNLWSLPSGGLLLDETTIHLRATSLDLEADAVTQCAALLSKEESTRADRFKFKRHRRRFVVRRGWLRLALGRCLDAAPATLKFDLSPRGKPALAPESNPPGIHFNLSHTEDLAVLALTRAGQIGVDVERIRPLDHMDDLVAQFFSPRENDLFQQLPEKNKLEAFYNLWTRKEAWLKATGEGISEMLGQVDVSFLPGERARVIALSGDASQAARWEMTEFAPMTGFVGAVCVGK